MNALLGYSRPYTAGSSVFDELVNGNVFESSSRALSSGSWPMVDVVETDRAYTIKADLPGLDKKDVTISVENNVLTLTGEKKNEVINDSKLYRYCERSYGKFSRSFSLADEVNVEEIAATMNNGVLALTLPKNEKTKPRLIEVQTN